MKNKVKFTFIIFCLLFGAVATRAFYIQIIDRDKLISYSRSQLIREVKEYPKRGFIYDRNGHPLAMNVQKFNIFIIPKSDKNYKEELKELSKIIPNLDVDKLHSNIKSRNKYTWITRNQELKEQDLEIIKKMEDIFYESQVHRVYPNNELLSQAMGFVNMDNEGLSGLELLYDKQLRGKPILKKYFKDAKGRPIKIESGKVDVKVEDLTLTIDKEIQASLEEHLKEGVLKANALRGGAAVMDATTGEILAIANYPTFDPNNYQKSNLSDRKLAFISDPFEPGSTFKTFTIAQALEHDIVTTDTNYFCEHGRFKVGKNIIKEAEGGKKFEWMSVEEILKYSSNIGTTKIAFDLNYPLLKEMFTQIGVGQKTGIELMGESRGIFNADEKPSPLRLSNMSFGHGVALTGIQLLKAYSIIANDGKLVSPTIIKNRKKQKAVSVISKKVAGDITAILIDAVESGTGTNAKIANFTIAGKTSTAQKVSPNGGYSGYISGFIGFPVNVKRKFITYVYVDDPKGQYYGNQVAAPIFKNITRAILYKNESLKTLAVGKKENMDHIAVNQSATIKMEGEIMPSLIGLDKKSAEKYLEINSNNYVLKGFGIVKRQEPAMGEKITKNTPITLYLAPPEYE